MTVHHQASGLKHGLALLINPHWTPEQAMAVIEVLDDLRDRIWTHYEAVLCKQYREDHVTFSDPPVTDPPF